ncbi:hypothetical protein ROZALSC1DRAFT_25033 [Rozella allomycis CSF55]|uniref:Uncharacterized protein n=1 Tax=Rozella allomycis (strain CSF55) TaxID=988480 RepID=A0A4P9YC20_ROZAC|nr:hypothetical protein ROZALSC1DRAFT_25033 [Rozella allomycis CSF55]
MRSVESDSLCRTKEFYLRTLLKRRALVNEVISNKRPNAVLSVFKAIERFSDVNHVISSMYPEDEEGNVIEVSKAVEVSTESDDVLDFNEYYNYAYIVGVDIWNVCNLAMSRAPLKANPNQNGDHEFLETDLNTKVCRKLIDNYTGYIDKKELGHRIVDNNFHRLLMYMYETDDLIAKIAFLYAEERMIKKDQSPKYIEDGSSSNQHESSSSSKALTKKQVYGTDVWSGFTGQNRQAKEYFAVPMIMQFKCYNQHRKIMIEHFIEKGLINYITDAYGILEHSLQVGNKELAEYVLQRLILNLPIEVIKRNPLHKDWLFKNAIELGIMPYISEDPVKAFHELASLDLLHLLIEEILLNKHPIFDGLKKENFYDLLSPYEKKIKDLDHMHLTILYEYAFLKKHIGFIRFLNENKPRGVKVSEEFVVKNMEKLYADEELLHAIVALDLFRAPYFNVATIDLDLDKTITYDKSSLPNHALLAFRHALNGKKFKIAIALIQKYNQSIGAMDTIRLLINPHKDSFAVPKSLGFDRNTVETIELLMIHLGDESDEENYKPINPTPGDWSKFLDNKNVDSKNFPTLFKILSFQGYYSLLVKKLLIGMAYKASKSELDSLLDLKRFGVLQLLAYYAVVVVKDQNLLGLIFGSFFLTQDWYHHRFFLAWGNGVYMNDQMRSFIVQLNAQDLMKLGTSKILPKFV